MVLGGETHLAGGIDWFQGTVTQLPSSRGYGNACKAPVDPHSKVRIQATKTKKGTMSMHDAVSSPLMAAQRLGSRTVGGQERR